MIITIVISPRSYRPQTSCSRSKFAFNASLEGISIPPYPTDPTLVGALDRGGGYFLLDMKGEKANSRAKSVQYKGLNGVGIPVKSSIKIPRNT